MQRVITAAVVLLCVRFAEAAPYEKSPAPSSVFDGIRPGMPLASAKLQTFAPDPSYRDAAARKRLVRDAGDGARYYVLVTGETISRIGVEAPARGLEAKLTKLWGTPTVAKNPANETLTSWSKAPWRVDLACRESLCRLAFHESLSAAFFGSGVTPPGALAALVPGMSRAQLATISPQHAGGADVPAGYEDVHVKVDVDGGAVRGVVIVGLPANALELATAAWGKPIASDRGPAWIGKRGWRAVYDADLRAISIAPYVTVSQLLGSGPGIAMLARPILGAEKTNIAASYPTFSVGKHGTGMLELPPIEAGTQPTRVEIGFDQAQRATTFAIALPAATAAARDAIVKLLTAKWGAPTMKNGALVFPTGKLIIELREAGRGQLVLSLAIA